MAPYSTGATPRAGGWGHGTMATVRWLRYDGYGTMATVRWLRYDGHGTMATVRWPRYDGYGTGATVRWLRYDGYGTMATARWLSHHGYGTGATVRGLRYGVLFLLSVFFFFFSCAVFPPVRVGFHYSAARWQRAGSTPLAIASSDSLEAMADMRGCGFRRARFLLLYPPGGAGAQPAGRLRARGGAGGAAAPRASSASARPGCRQCAGSSAGARGRRERGSGAPGAA